MFDVAAVEKCKRQDRRGASSQKGTIRSTLPHFLATLASRDVLALSMYFCLLLRSHRSQFQFIDRYRFDVHPIDADPHSSIAETQFLDGELHFLDRSNSHLPASGKTNSAIGEIISRSRRCRISSELGNRTHRVILDALSARQISHRGIYSDITLIASFILVGIFSALRKFR